MSQVRKSNIELLRIVAMLGIIAGHYVTFGVLNSHSTDISWLNGDYFHRIYTFFFGHIFAGGGTTAVAIFFIITGYFKINNDKIKLSKIFQQVLFYAIFSVLLFFLCYLIFGINAPIKNVFSTLFASITLPISSNLWWFVTAYVVLCCLTPALNPILRKLPIRWYLRLIILWWALEFSVGNIFTHLGSFCPYLALQDAVLFYMIGGYIKRKDEMTMNMPFQKISNNIGAWCLLILLVILRCFQDYIHFDESLIKNISHATILSYALRSFGYCILHPLIAIFTFVLFKRLPLRNCNFINKIASTTFGVYLLHMSPLLCGYIWNDIFEVLKTQYFDTLYPLKSFLTVITIYTICCVIDLLRQRLVVPYLSTIFIKVDKRIFDTDKS